MHQNDPTTEYVIQSNEDKRNGLGGDQEIECPRCHDIMTNVSKIYDGYSSMLLSDVGACVLIILEILSCLLHSIFDRTLASYRYNWMVCRFF